MHVFELSFLFFFISLIYSIAGFGGGSSYIALLSLSAISYTIAPIIALLCNISVVSISSIRFFKQKQIPFKLLLPLTIASIPMSYIGGSILISKKYFLLILAVLLLLSSLLMIFSKVKNNDELKHFSKTKMFAIGSVIGFLSGLIGIGGGIFLSPVLNLFQVEKAKKIAAVCSVFILLNSISGLIGQLHKYQSMESLLKYYPLLLSVILGGSIGNYLCNFKISNRVLKKITGGIILYISLKILMMHS